MGIKINQLLRDANRGEILIPHINLYQDKGKFPKVRMIEIRNSKPTDTYFHPSGDCMETIPSLYAKFTEPQKEKNIPFSLRRVFDTGHFWHGYYQEILKEMKLCTDAEIEQSHQYKHPDGWTAKGTLDALVDIPRNGKFIIDFKTVNDIEYDRGIRPENMKKWRAQTNMYMSWTGVENALIVAIRKGGTPGLNKRPMHDLKEIVIERDSGLVEQIYRRWSLVWLCIQEGRPPTTKEIKNVAFD